MTDFTKDPSLFRPKGWRADKGPQRSNTSGLRATGHRLLLLEAPAEEVTSGGIVLARKTVDKEKIRQVVCTVVEIGHDAWSDKSTDFCDVGDKVLVGEYTGKLHESHLDGKSYRFLNDLDVISPVFGE
jgi:co-chaperonin GroES (HSP10)